MSNTPKNRAQRRLEQRRAASSTPSYWSTTGGKITGVLIGLAVFAVVVVALWPKPTPEQAARPTTPTTPITQPAAPPVTQPTATATPATPPPDPNAKLVSTDEKEGTGAAAKAGDKVTVHYTGTLPNGTKFDSSRDKGEPYTFTLGAGTVIKGWDQGLVGMKPGGKRKLVIPPALGYGAADKGKIPPNSTLNFDVEMVKIEPGS